MATSTTSGSASGMGSVPRHVSGTTVSTSLPRRLAVLVGAVAQVATSAYVMRANTDQFSKPLPEGDPLFVPAGYAFSIWGVLFTGTIAYAIYQLLPRNAGQPLLARIGWPAALAFLGSATWVLFGQDRSYIGLNLAILAFTAGSTFVAVRAIEREQAALTNTERYVVRAPLSMYLGWTSVATFANLALALRLWGVTSPGAETVPTLLLLAAVAGVAVVTLRVLRGNWWYAGTVVWALVAVAVANYSGDTRTPDMTIVVAAAAVAVLVVVAALLIGRSAPARDATTARTRAA